MSLRIQALTFLLALLFSKLVAASPVAAAAARIEPTPPPGLAPRDAVTEYTYLSTAAAYVIAPVFGDPTDCGEVVTAAEECPFGCAAAWLPGAVGVATTAFTCVDPPTVTSWAEVVVTSTCPPGETVAVLTPWGAKVGVPECRETGS